MEASDWIALAALVVSIVALIVTAWQNHKTREDAKAGSDKAMAEARKSREVADRHADAAERAAKAAELTAEAMRAMAEEARRSAALGGSFAPQSADDQVADHQRTNNPLTLEKGRGQTYVLRNTSFETLEDVTLTTDHPEALTRNIPSGETLPPGQGIAFLIAGSLQAPLPNDVQVSWEGTNPLHLSLPS